MHFILILFFLIPSFLISQDNLGGSSSSEVLQSLKYSDERFKLKYNPRTDVLTDGNILKMKI